MSGGHRPAERHSRRILKLVPLVAASVIGMVAMGKKSGSDAAGVNANGQSTGIHLAGPMGVRQTLAF